MEGDHNGYDGREPVRRPLLMLLVPFLEKVIADHDGRMIESVYDVLDGQAMPHPHEGEQQDVAKIRQQHLVLDPALLLHEEHEAHEYIIPEPEGKGHMPPVPEVLDVPAQERLVEVLRGTDAHHVADPNGKRRIPGEIEEQVHAVAVHIEQVIEDLVRRHIRQVHDEIGIDRISDDEFIKESDENLM